MRPYVCTNKVKYYLSLQYSPSSPLWTGTAVRHSSNNNNETGDSNQNNNISNNNNNDSSQPPKKAKRMSITIRSGSARAKAKEERKKNTKTKPENGMEKTTDYFINHHKHTNPPMQVTLANAMEEDPDWDTLRPTAASINLLHYNNHNQQNIMEQVGPTPSQRLDGVNEMRTRRTSRTRFVEPVKRIILIRNGHSAANDNLNTYVTTPDWRIPLVREGVQQCLKAGREVADIVGAEPVYFYYSPYIRSRQSLRYVLEGYDEGRRSNVSQPWWSSEDPSENNNNNNEIHNNTVSPPQTAAPEVEPPHPTTTSNTVNDLLFLRQDSSDIIGVREDVRLRDGDIGRYSSLEELLFHIHEREKYGKFFYRFPFGESGADVCDRVTSFLDAFQRERVNFPMDTNVVIITHGLTMRMFVKRWFHLTVDTFHKMKSPPSGSVCTLTRLHHRSCFRMDEACVESMQLPYSLNENNGYKYRNKNLLGSMSSGAPYM